MQFPKITVVVNKIKKKHSVSCCCSKVAAMWCIRLARGWHFNICLLSGEQQQRRTLLILISASVTLLRGGKYIYQAAWMNTSWLQVSVSVTSPQRSEASCQTVPFPILLIPLPSFVLQGHWWSWSQPAVTMPATLTASSQCSCAHYRRWCGNTWAPSRLTQGWLKPAQVHKYSGKMWGSQWQM